MKLTTAFAAMLFAYRRDTAVHGQQVGKFETEGSPTILLKECTNDGGCKSSQAKLTLDANWRWTHSTTGSNNCYDGDSWDSQLCSDPVQCAQNCALEGVSQQKYKDTYGIEQIQDGVKLNFVTQHQYGTNVGSRLYVLDDDDSYKLFYLKNREFSLDIDVSKLECGMNGAMYFTEMDKQGGKGMGSNNAGSKYGTGYCDAQCPHDTKFINGVANVIDWTPNPKDPEGNTGGGKYGACCAEMDIWEANKMATAYTPHPCSIEGLHRCDGEDCGDNDKGQRYEGVCDKDGCDMQPYRLGNEKFYGPGSDYLIDTTQKMTVVTQFLTTDGTDDGDLSEIRRYYIQNDRVIHSPETTILGNDDNTDSITDGFCDAKKELFDDVNDYKELGGSKAMGESLDRGHVMIFSLWDDVEVNMNWLDSAFPLDRPVSDPGVKRGDCPGGRTSTPEYVRNNFPNGYVSFQNAIVGEIGSIHGVFPPSRDNDTPSDDDDDEEERCGCGPKPGTNNNEECFSLNKKKCIRKKNKCLWTQCTPPPTLPPVEPPTAASEGCYSNDYKNCLPKSISDDTTFQSCTTIWLPNGSEQNCEALWNECSDSNDCCGPATCFSDGSNSVCVPRQGEEEPKCIQCDDEESNGMKKKGQDCTRFNLSNKCNLSINWSNNKFCQLSCFDAGLGYDGDVCCQSNDETPTLAPVPKPTNNRPTKSPVPDPTRTPTRQPVLPPTQPPVGGGNGCCTLNYQACIDWCGSSYDSCINCSNRDVGWLPNGAPSNQCVRRWDRCDGNPNGCCDGLSCQNNACLPDRNPTPSPVRPPPTNQPTTEPTLPPVPTISPAPTTEPSPLLRTDKAMNAWDVFLGLDYITHKNSATNYALVASGGAAGGGNLVVSESQAYGLLITGTVLASWDTHASKVRGSKRSDVLQYFEGYYNFWKQMCKDSTENVRTNCQPGGNYCKDDSTGASSVCLPDWRHYKTGGSEATGPAPDADEDAIVGIMLAVKAVKNDRNKPSWYDEARKWADASATAFYEFEVDKSRSDHRLVKLGSCWGGWENEGNNPSYHSPGSFRVMKDYQYNFPNNLRKGYSAVSQSNWKKLIDTSHEVLRAVQCSNDGALVPNWATIGLDRGEIKHSGGSFSGSGTPQYEYGAEAARTTFRVALDAAFYPEKSTEWSQYLSSFNWRLDGGYRNGSFSSGTFQSCRGPQTNQNINMFGGWLNKNNEFISGPTFTALIAASSDIGNAEAMIDSAGSKMAQSLPGSYYPRSWAMISNLMLNGAMESAGQTLKQ